VKIDDSHRVLTRAEILGVLKRGGGRMRGERRDISDPSFLTRTGGQGGGG